MNSRIAASLLAAMLALGALLTGCSSGGNGIANPANFTRTPDSPVEQTTDMAGSGMWGSSFGAIDVNILGGDISDPESILSGVNFSDNANDWYPIPNPPGATGATKAAAQNSPATTKAMITVTALAKSALQRLAASGSKTGASETNTIDFTDENGTAWSGTSTVIVSDTAYAGAIDFDVTGTNDGNTITIAISGNASISREGKAVLSGRFNIGTNLSVYDESDVASRVSATSLESSFGGTLSVDAQFVTRPATTGVQELPFGDMSSFNCRVGLQALTSIDGSRVLDANLNFSVRILAVEGSRRSDVHITLAGEQLFVARDGYWVKKKQDVTVKINVNTPNYEAGTFWLKASDGYSMQLDLPTLTGTVKNAAGVVIANITPDEDNGMTINFIDPDLTDVSIQPPLVAILFGGIV